MSQSGEKEAASIVDLNTFRRRKKIADELARGRKPLYTSYLNGDLSGRPETFNRADLPKEPNNGFSDRLQRIRQSLERINALMAELKKISKDQKDR